MKKKIAAIFLMLIYMVTFTGCFNYADLDKILFVTAIVYDIDPDNSIDVYLEAFMSQRTISKGTEKAQRLIFRGNGKTAFEAIKDINLRSSYKVNYTQNKAIIFSEKAARAGVKQFIDIERRNHEFYLKPYVAVYLGNIQDLLQGGFKEEDYVGFLLNDLMNNEGQASRAIRLQYRDFLNTRTEPDRVNVMTAITVDKTKNKNSVELNGGAVFKNDKMVDTVDKSETQAYNFMIGKVQAGSMEVLDPTSKNAFISLDILKSKTKTDVVPYKNKVEVNKKIDVKTSIAESQNYITLDEKTIEKIQENAEKNLINNSKKIFDKYKKKGIDIFNIEDDYENKYKVRKPNLIKSSELHIEPNVIIEGGGKSGTFN